MNAEEYKKWLKENANQEEAMAFEVAQKIVRFHEKEYADESAVEYFPRYILIKDKERVEFDLLIKITWKTGKRKYERLIGVEFKEHDVKKVLMQAVRRSMFVDYMYIATRNVWLDYEDVFILAYFGLGWIIWENGFVKLITPSRYMVKSYTFNRLLNQAIDTIIEDKIREKVEKEIDKISQQTLVRWVDPTLDT